MIRLNPTMPKERPRTCVTMIGLSRQGKWSGAVVILFTLGSAVGASAQGPFGAGRLLGVGWADGYHACANSGIQPGLESPPGCYSAGCDDRCSLGCDDCSRTPIDAVRLQSHRFHHGGGTYYDRFDTANPRPGDTASHCNCTTIPNVYGSEVILRPSTPETQQTPQRPGRMMEQIPGMVSPGAVSPGAVSPGAVSPGAVIEQSQNPSGRRLARFAPRIERIARPSVLFSETPYGIIPNHPGDRPIVERTYTASAHGVKLYPHRLPVDPPPRAQAAVIRKQTVIGSRLVQMEGVGAIHANPYFSGGAVGVASQPNLRSSSVIQQPRQR
jgi:hypothetical protein